jgi:hypothetical protein
MESPRKRIIKIRMEQFQNTDKAVKPYRRMLDLRFSQWWS